jgi:NAD(P)-dependent dehydrogenase (short-subunit alcohol dehydrogenase family)
MAGELDGKVAVVTGAASGIGLASSEAMLALGARVVMVDRDEAALKRLRGEHGEAVLPLSLTCLTRRPALRCFLRSSKAPGSSTFSKRTPAPTSAVTCPPISISRAAIAIP